jgi:hypothetical protein
LVITSTTRDGIVPLLDVDRHLDTLATLFDVPADLRDRLHVVIKCHPRHDHPETYEMMIRQQTGGNASVVTEDAIEQVTSLARVAVVANTPTTAYLEPIFQRKPLLFVDTARASLATRMPGTELNSVTSNDEIWPALRRLLDDRSHQTDVTDRQWAFMQADMPLGEAAARVLAAVSDDGAEAASFQL